MKIFCFFLLLATLTGLAYSLAFADYFLIEKIEVQTDNPKINTTGLADTIVSAFRREMNGHERWLPIPQNNIFFLSRKKAIKNLLTEFPLFKDFKLRYDFANRTLVIEGIARNAAAKLCRESSCYLLDEEGIVFAPVPENSASNSDEPKEYLLFLVDQGVDNEILPGKQFLSKELIEFTLGLQAAAKNNANIKYFAVEKDYLEARFVKAVIAGGWYFLTRSDLKPSAVIENMDLVIEKELNQDQSKLEYIDLRYKDKAYYKLR